MAISASAVWEVRTTGSDANGGLFAGGGIDYSQQDAPALSLTDVATNGTTTVTSATGGFGSAHIGNGINIGGTIRQITAVASTNSITIDAAMTTAAGQLGKVGGALGSPGMAAGFMTSGNAIWIRTGTYNITTATLNVAGGCISLSQGTSGGIGTTLSSIRGYGATRGDGIRPTLKLAAAVASAKILNANGSMMLFRDLIVDGNGQASSFGFATDSSSGRQLILLHRVAAVNCSIGIQGVNGRFSYCEAIACTEGISVNNGTFFRCEAHGCTTGFGTNGGTVVQCLSWGNSGHGFYAGNTGFALYQCTAANNGGGGFQLTGGGPFRGVALVDSVAYGNAGGDVVFEGGRDGIIAHRTAYGTASWSATQHEADIAMSATPFVDAAAGNLSLNGTSGGGARARGQSIAFPGIATTSYPDIGAVQHQDSGTGPSAPAYTGEVLR